MGDLIKDFEIFKRLGFDSCNQWVLYDENFQKFFTWFTEHIMDNNILHDNEYLESTELKRCNEYKSQFHLNQLKETNEVYKSITEYNNQDLENLENEIKYLLEAEAMHEHLNHQMEISQKDLIRNLIDLEKSCDQLETRDKKCKLISEERAKKLQEAQSMNRKLSFELNETYLKNQNPPLFVHEMSLEKYFIKCDSFLQYLTLYLKDNFKIQNFFDGEDKQDDLIEITEQIEKIEKQIYLAELDLTKVKVQKFGLKKMAFELNISKDHPISIEQIKKETRDLEIFNKDHLEITCDTLMSELKIYLEQKSQYQIELILYENTKEKFERVQHRFENVKFLSKIVSEAVLNAEIVWILMQFDIEKTKNRFDSLDDLRRENQMCVKRMELMRRLQLLNFKPSDWYIEKLSKIFSNNWNPANSIKSFLYEYEKFSRSLTYLQKNILSKKHYSQAIRFLNELSSIDKLLVSYVFDGPINKPMFENILFLEKTFKARETKENTEKSIKHLRTEYHEHIQKMMCDRLWKYKQLLWIWFLTEPKKVLNAIDEASKTASKIPAVPIKTLSGIKRK